MSYKIGDKVRGCDVYSFGGMTWMHIYEILNIENKTRFGKPAQLFTVQITTTNGNVVEPKTKRWANQLF